MENTSEKTTKRRVQGLHILVMVIGILAIITSATGLFYTNGAVSFSVTNIYGKTIKMWGDGLYKNDSYFKAPLSKGTDLSLLLFSIPVLFFALLQDIRKATFKTRLFLVSLLGIFTYYSASYSFGVTYNPLFLCYIAMLTCSFFGIIMGIRSINLEELKKNLGERISLRAIYNFSILSGLALFVAWLPDIISSLMAGSTLQIIDTYTTEITYVIDMGILSPLFFATVFLIHKREGLGYLSFLILSMLCIQIVPVLTFQSVFQTLAGIETPIAAIITKIGSFILLGFWAVYLQIRIYKKIAIQNK